MKALQPVVWSKGTFLTPHHLQAQDRFSESLLQFRLEALSFRPYGFLSLEIDRDALAEGNLIVGRASGVLPDGMAFDIPNADAAPAPKPIADHLKGDVQSVEAYLAIPPYRESGLNVAMSQARADARFVAEVAMLRDENSGLNEKPIQVARKNFRLLAGAELGEGTIALPLGHIRRTPSGSFDLDPAFVPPLLNSASSDALTTILRRLVEILTSRGSQLSGARRQRNQSLADFTSGDIASFWLLYAINSHLPGLRHLLETRRGHPETFFSIMNSLASELCTFSTKIAPRDLPLYDHMNLGPCFTKLDEQLRFLLDTVVPSNFVSLALKQTQTSVYATAIDHDKYLVNTKLYLAISSGMPEAELITRVPHLVKVCSATHVETLIRQALPGVPLLHVTAPPSAIPIKLNYQYFSLSQSGPAWEAVLRARNFAAYVPADFREPNLELIILLPQAQ